MKTRLLLGVLAFATGLFAQGERGTLNGTVTDPSGAVVAGATVKAVNVGDGRRESGNHNRRRRVPHAAAAAGNL